MSLGIDYNNPGLPVSYSLNSDPTLFTGWGGTNAEEGSILYRTDVVSIYRKTGPNAVDWTLQSGGSSGVEIRNVRVPIAGNPHSILNFQNGVFGTDAGGGAVDIAMSPNVQSPVRPLDTPFQPDVNRVVICIYTLQISVGLGGGSAGADGAVDLLADPFNPPTTVRGSIGIEIVGTLTNPLDQVVNRLTETLSFPAPAGWWVTIATRVLSGGPSFALQAVSEIGL